MERVIAVINGKGGVLKTSIVANVAGQLAAAGYQILAVDLDVGGNLKLDFGLAGDEREDGGRGLTNAVWADEPMPLVAQVRENLDMIFGGRHLELLGAMAKMNTAEELPTGSVPAEFARKLGEVADRYDLILLDCPPGNSELQEMALAAARWVLVPTKTDQASWDGLLGVGPRVTRSRAINPELSYLGVVITAHDPSATRVRRNTEARLEEVGETVPLLDSFVRHSEATAHDCRSRGQLAHELARDVSDSKTHRLRALKERRLARRAERGSADVIALPTALPATAGSLAEDYSALAYEICRRIGAAEGTRSRAGGTP